MQAIAHYVEKMTIDDLQFADIRFNGQVFFSAEHIKDLYKELPKTMPSADKLVQLKNKLIRELQRRVKDEAKKDWVAKELDSLDLQQLHNLYGKKSIAGWLNVAYVLLPMLFIIIISLISITNTINFYMLLKCLRLSVSVNGRR